MGGMYGRESLGITDRIHVEGSPSTSYSEPCLRSQAIAQFKRRSTANNVEIIVPVPEDADSPRFRTNIGSVHYAPEKSAIVWKIKAFAGGKEFLMRAELGLPSVKEAEPERKRRPISVKFEIPYFTTSGIQVRYLKIIEPKLQYPSLPWVRYISCASGKALTTHARQG